MRDYTKVSPSIWSSPRFLGLKSDEARLLMLYIVTNKHQTSAGVYALPEGYARVDLGDWPEAKYRAAFRNIIDAGLIRFDIETSEVMVERWFRHNPPMSVKHFVGSIRIIDRQIKSEGLREAAREACEQAWADVQSARQKEAERSTPNQKVSPLLRTAQLSSVVRT